MEELTITKKNHTLKVTVQGDFVEAAALLSNDLYLRMTMKSNNMSAAAKATYEQQVYRSLIKGIFCEKTTYIYQFTTPQALYDFKAARGIKVPNNNSNAWFRTACIAISNYHPKSEILAYIRKKSDDFEKKPFILP